MIIACKAAPACKAVREYKGRNIDAAHENTGHIATAANEIVDTSHSYIVHIALSRIADASIRRRGEEAVLGCQRAPACKVEWE